MSDYEPVAGPSSASDALLEEPSHIDEDFSDDGDYVKRRLYVSEIMFMWNLSDIVRELGTNEQCVRYSEDEGLVLKNRKCGKHKTNMKISYSSGCKSLGTFICAKASCKGKAGGSGVKISRRQGTFFENVTLDMPHIYYLIYAYSQGWSYNQTIHEDPYKRQRQQCLSPNTICDWYNYCREVVVIYYLEKQNQFTGKIGGPGKIVQIDESKFGKRKYNKGRHIEGHWVLGMIEDGSEDLRLEVCPDNIRSAEVLVPLIQRHVAAGTTIHTDCWRAYDCLAEHGYTHKKVNHSDPDNPFVAEDGTHTQRIESQWRAVKRFFRKQNYNNSQSFTDVIVEYLWRRNVEKFKKDPFKEIMRAIKHVYKIN
ncbi:unnamed protein product [Parnassius mnemosyne]|uniref:ISXO2-like transposase domain-containing protein n=2 Tax=Parnassius mnemosyne TaxID=213953 RepID=A0AAV1LUE9_9NEOP